MKLAAKTVSILAIAACVLWYSSQPGFRPVFGGLSSPAFLLALFVSDRKSYRKTVRQEKAIQAAYDRIEKELSNFAELAAGGRKSYNSELHRKAATIYPYEKSLESLCELRDSGKYPITSRRLIWHLERKNAEKVYHLMKRLHSKLRKEPSLST